MTQVAVAGKSGMESSYISRLESGKVSPTVSTLERLAGALEIDCSKILAVAEIYAKSRDD